MRAFRVRHPGPTEGTDVTRLRLIPAVLLAGALVAGCGVDTAPTVAPPASESPKAPLALEPATGKPIVTFKGLVNGGKPLSADMASFNALPKQTLTVLEPFVKKSVTFSGVGFADLLAAAEVTGKSVTIHALDDYEATFDAAVLREPGVLLATRADGKAIDVSAGGPVRLVFPPSSETGKDTDTWVWSIDQIIVE
jgi:hypothetical protein